MISRAKNPDDSEKPKGDAGQKSPETDAAEEEARTKTVRMKKAAAKKKKASGRDSARAKTVPLKKGTTDALLADAKAEADARKASEAPAETAEEGKAEDDPEGTAGGAPTNEEDEVGAPLSGDRLRACIEAILFAAAEPVPRKKLRRMLRGVDNRDIDEALLALEADLVTHNRGFGLVEEAAGLRLLSRPEFAPYIARLRGERRIRLSQAAFESLAVIAYRQPIRRSDLEGVRGVQSGNVLKNLIEWNLIQIVGRDEQSLGRPLLYGTTQTFLEQFGLSELGGLPKPEDLLELGEEHGMEIIDGGEDGAPRKGTVEPLPGFEPEKSENAGAADAELSEAGVADEPQGEE